MQILSERAARQRLDDMNADVRHVRVTKDRRIITYHATVPAHTGKVRRVPALFVHLCVAGGGHLKQKAGISALDTDIAPGDIGVSPPNAQGMGRWPEMTVIAIGIAVDSLVESFGENWPERIKVSALTETVRDPLVEAMMMDVGYTRANKVTDSTLLHAAHMIAHQLLDQPFEDDKITEEVTPLTKRAVQIVNDFLIENIDRHVAVSEMAETVGISRHHFSRRFKVATGETPHQFAIRGKLDHAAKMLEAEDRESVLSISNSIGYANPAQFAKVFRRHFGLSPRKWRKRHIQNKSEGG
ncbi:MAG: AraC family transcriptional regulator [Pseudomonadota bacterium]